MSDDEHVLRRTQAYRGMPRNPALRTIEHAATAVAATSFVRTPDNEPVLQQERPHRGKPRGSSRRILQQVAPALAANADSRFTNDEPVPVLQRERAYRGMPRDPALRTIEHIVTAVAATSFGSLPDNEIAPPPESAHGGMPRDQDPTLETIELVSAVPAAHPIRRMPDNEPVLRRELAYSGMPRDPARRTDDEPVLRREVAHRGTPRDPAPRTAEQHPVARAAITARINGQSFTSREPQLPLNHLDPSLLASRPDFLSPLRAPLHPRRLVVSSRRLAPPATSVRPRIQVPSPATSVGPRTQVPSPATSVGPRTQVAVPREHKRMASNAHVPQPASRSSLGFAMSTASAQTGLITVTEDVEPESTQSKVPSDNHAVDAKVGSPVSAPEDASPTTPTSDGTLNDYTSHYGAHRIEDWRREGCYARCSTPVDTSVSDDKEGTVEMLVDGIRKNQFTLPVVKAIMKEATVDAVKERLMGRVQPDMLADKLTQVLLAQGSVPQ